MGDLSDRAPNMKVEDEEGHKAYEALCLSCALSLCALKIPAGLSVLRDIEDPCGGITVGANEKVTPGVRAADGCRSRWAAPHAPAGRIKFSPRLHTSN